MALPDYVYYYRAANIHKLVFWDQEEVDKEALQEQTWDNTPTTWYH